MNLQEALRRFPQWIRESRKRQLLTAALGIVAVAAIGVAAYFVAFAGDDGDRQSVEQSPSPSPPAVRASPRPQTPSPSATGPALPAIVDAEELFVVDADGGEPVLIHRTAGYIGRQIAWSPNGERLAFAASEGGQIGVYVADVTRQARLAVRLDNDYAQLAWSPEGDRLAVGGTATGDDGTASSVLAVVEPASLEITELYSEPVPPDGSPVTLLSWTPDTRLLFTRGNDLVAIDTVSRAETTVASGLGEMPSPYGKFDFDVSPDGAQVALAVRESGGDCTFLDLRSVVLVQLADGVTSEVVTACGVGDVAWSHDGTELAYSIGAGDKGTYVLNLATGQTKRLTTGQGVAIDTIDWVPDGSGVAIRGCYEGCGSPRFVPISGGDEQVLANLDGLYGGFGGFSPDSKQFLYGDDAVRLGTLRGDIRALTTPDPGAGFGAMAWSPRGDKVAYVASANQATREYAVDLQTGEVTRQIADSRQGKLSPDGNLRAYTKSKEQGAPGQFWVSDADGKNERQLSGDSPSSFEWSPDSTRIAYAEELTDAVNIIDLDSGQTVPLDIAAGHYTVAGWSADGSFLALVFLGVVEDGTFQPRGELTVVDARAGTGKVVATGLSSFPSLPLWSPDGSSLLFTTNDASRNADLVIVNADGTGERRLTTTAKSEHGAAWSPDGEAIVFRRDVSSPPDAWIEAVYVLPLETGRESELTRFELGSGGAGDRLAWSADGERLAMFAGATTDAGIYVIEADGSGVTHVAATSGGRGYSDLAWSDDGRQILFRSSYQGL